MPVDGQMRLEQIRQALEFPNGRTGPGPKFVPTQLAEIFRKWPLPPGK
jgi:hypothetical protein